jgi:hypothetical protein
MNSLPYSLSVADAELFKSLQQSALLPSLASPGEGELAQLHKAAKKEEQRKTFEPYADILVKHIVDKVREDKTSILEQLKKNPGGSMVAPLFTWHTVYYNESLSQMAKRRSTMSPSELFEFYADQRKRTIEINSKRWETEMSVYESVYDYYLRDTEETYSMYPAKINKVFQVTDVAERVSLALGPCFYPYTVWEPLEGLGDDDPETGFSVFKRTLYVRYHPYGVTPEKMKTLLKTARTQAERKREDKIRELYHTERLDITGSPVIVDDYADMPSLISAAHQDRCFCGCGEDDSE